MTADGGSVEETIDYRPYGSVRIDEKATDWSEQRKFAGHEFDDASGFSYMEARYYDSESGRFLNVDPVAHEIGLSEDGKKALLNPQALNSYSYAGNNPMKYRDADGRFWWKEFYTDWNGYDLSRPLWQDNGLTLKAGEVLGGRASAIWTIQNNAENIRQASKQSGVNENLIKGIIYEEQSHQFPPAYGEMIAEKLVPDLFRGGVGVMQVSSKTSGINNAELLNSKKNISTGASVLRGIQQSGWSGARDTATRYNDERGGGHGQRYGVRVESYVNNQTYTSNFDRLTNSVSGLVNRVGGLFSGAKK